ncbi:MAG: HlyD family efflux transporter periplasmic adaptor subunit [Campylobacterota bacterium]|nr:HlyD family efflux transporter periplasmic adaptor subunit [Campylobacterota bacterium]
MKLYILILILLSSTYAKEYYAKVEPFEIYTISSNVNAQVVNVEYSKEGKILDDKAYIVLDDVIDVKELKSLTRKIKFLETTLKLTQDSLKNYKEILEKKHKNYTLIKDLKVKSNIEKDGIYYEYLNTQNQYIATQKEIENLKVSINDFKFRKEQLKKSINDKHLKADGKILYELLVKGGEVVNPSTPLARIADISKAKLTLFLDSDDVEDIENKEIFINGKKSSAKIRRLWNIADSKHLSSYEAHIIIDAPKRFSNLVKVEFKEAK